MDMNKEGTSEFGNEISRLDDKFVAGCRSGDVAYSLRIAKQVLEQLNRIEASALSIRDSEYRKGLIEIVRSHIKSPTVI